MTITIQNQKPLDYLLDYERETLEWVMNFVLELTRDTIFSSGSMEDSLVNLYHEFDDWAIVLHRDDALLSPVIPSHEAPEYGYVVLLSHLIDVVLENLEGLTYEAPIEENVDKIDWAKVALSKDFDRLSEGMDGYFLSYEDFKTGDLISSLQLDRSAEEPYFYTDRTTFTYELSGRERKYDVQSETKVIYVILPRKYREQLKSLAYTECLKKLYELFGLDWVEE